MNRGHLVRPASESTAGGAPSDALGATSSHEPPPTVTVRPLAHHLPADVLRRAGCESADVPLSVERMVIATESIYDEGALAMVGRRAGALAV